MNINKFALYFLFPTVILMTQGCSSKVDSLQEQKIRNFVEPEQNKSAIYLYRTSHMRGSFKDADIIFDNKKIVELENGSFVYIPTNAGSHTLVSSQSNWIRSMLTGEGNVGFLFRIKTEPNKNYFLEFVYLDGKFVVKEPTEAIREINDCDLLPLEENDKTIAKTPLFSVDTKLYNNNLQYLNNNNVSINVVDDRPFADTVSSAEDASNYIIDRNQDDTKENREKTVGYMLTTFSGLANVIVQDKIKDIISNYTQNVIEQKSLKNKDVRITISELWISPNGSSSNVFFNLALNRKVNNVKSVGYRYSVSFISNDKETEGKTQFVCSNANYRENVWSVSKEEISSLYESMMSEIDTCVKEKLN